MYAAYGNECIEFLEGVKAGLERNNIKAAIAYQDSPLLAAFYTDKWIIAVSELVPPPPSKNISLRILGVCKHEDKVFTVSYAKKIKRV